jgi:hypothetical protein
MFLWIKVSSVIQTLSAPHIKGKIFNFLRKEKVNVQLCILIDLKTDRIKGRKPEYLEKTTDLPQVTDKYNVVSSTPRLSGI